MITLTEPVVLAALAAEDSKALARLQLLDPSREVRSQAASAGRRLATAKKRARLIAEQGQDSLGPKVSIQVLENQSQLNAPRHNQPELSNQERLSEVQGVLTARDLTGLQRRRLFNRMVKMIDAGLVATIAVTRCDVCHKALGATVERPDWTARTRAADLSMALLGSSAPKQPPASGRKGPVSREPEWLRKMRTGGAKPVPEGTAATPPTFP